MQIIQFSKKDFVINIDKFCSLYKKVFTAKIDNEILYQRYIDNGQEDILMFVAVEDDHIIANYSAVPVTLMVNGAEIKAALSLNTMVDPQYQGKGIAIILARKLYAYMTEKKYDLVYGFPNCDANRMFNESLGWRTIYEIPTMKLSIADVKMPYSINFEIVQDNYDSICGNDIDKKIYAKHSKNYINWRFRDNKEKEYHLLSADETNWIIYQRYNDEINITEIDCSDSRKAHELIKSVVNKAINEHYISVTTWYSINTKIHSFLETMGFKVTSPVRVFSARCFNKAIENEVYDYNNWKICMGDDNAY